MANEGNVNLPGGFGGLVRYGDEYSSKINLKPIHVIGFIAVIVALRVFLEVVY